MSFELFETFRNMDLKEWILWGVMFAALVALVVYLIVSRKKKSAAPAAKGFDTRALVYGALCMALSFVLSYLRIVKMPQGGSITIASMLPIIVYAYWYGPRKGILVGIAYALLQMIQDAYFVHPIQILLDYILAFGVLGLAGFFRKNFYVGVIVAGLCRFVCHFLSGAIFFGEYAPTGVSPWIYSLGYQAEYLIPDIIICFVAALLLKSTIDRLNPNKSISAVQSKAN